MARLKGEGEPGSGSIAYFLNKETNEVRMDFNGTVHASDNLVPISPEEAAIRDQDWLWGECGMDLYEEKDTADYNAELDRRRAIRNSQKNN